MSLKQYRSDIDEGIIPDWPPYGTSPWGNTWPSLDDRERYLSVFETREFCLARGLWTVVDKNWTGVLAEWLEGRKLLEIMAGAGFLAKALSEKGVEVVATDGFTWDKRHKHMKLVHEVLKMDAVDAAGQLPADALLVSWPPFGELAIIDACRAWGPDRPIIYIGEGMGGCNAPDPFFHAFHLIEHPMVPLMSWPGLHDEVQIGHFHEMEGDDDDDDYDGGG